MRLCPRIKRTFMKNKMGKWTKWLMIDLEDQGEMFADVLQLIEIRRG